MAGLRYILVHGYVKINSNLIAEHLRRLDDFRAFARHVLDYIESLRCP